MDLQFRRLSEADPENIIRLMNDPKVRALMPLTKDDFDEDDCARFVAAKERLWEEHGYGPWAFFIDGAFAGWGGLQPEDGDADLGLVLGPRYWGCGRAIYDEILRRGFGEMGFESVTILLPPSRTRVKGLSRAGFLPDGETEFNGERFVRYRLMAPTSPG